MKNRTIAFFGIGTYILSVLSSAEDLEGNPNVPIALVAISGIATFVFIVMATIRLWKEAKSLSIILASSTIILFLLTVVQLISLPSSQGSIILLNIFNVIYFVSRIWAIIRLFKLKDESNKQPILSV